MTQEQTQIQPETELEQTQELPPIVGAQDPDQQPTIKPANEYGSVNYTEGPDGLRQYFRSGSNPSPEESQDVAPVTHSGRKLGIGKYAAGIAATAVLFGGGASEIGHGFDTLLNGADKDKATSTQDSQPSQTPPSITFEMPKPPTTSDAPQTHKAEAPVTRVTTPEAPQATTVPPTKEETVMPPSKVEVTPPVITTEPKPTDVQVPKPIDKTPEESSVHNPIVHEPVPTDSVPISEGNPSPSLSEQTTPVAPTSQQQ